MDSFWASATNKTKVQGLLRNFIIGNPKPMKNVVVSSMGLSNDSEPCKAIYNKWAAAVPELDLSIEADVRIIPHALHAVCSGASMIVVLSNDTGVMVIGLNYWDLLKSHGLRACGLELVWEILPDIYLFISWLRATRLSMTYPPAVILPRGIFSGHFMGRYMQLHCLEKVYLDPRNFGYSVVDGIFEPERCQVLLPDDFPMPLNARPVPLSDVFVDNMNEFVISTAAAKLLTRDVII
ncbi:hypothetical protein GWK47_040612 [Chionoecetes opilio]|uniref:Uncharacterized protein n=1 Tax=Chionoecetes opilio TaxID=41210 RepID=A0A8J4YC24_CHIOP|nr:hypothetical protein GWK47_040612 [Chionoecetes opilio]